MATRQAPVVQGMIADLLAEAFEATRAEMPRVARNAYNQMVEVYVYPTQVWQVGVSCLSFFVIMLGICFAVELNNPLCNAPGRWKQIRAEIAESLPAVVCSTSISLAHLRWIYPLRWGFRAPVFPASPGEFAFECVYWMACFEVFVYALHRFLHWRRPVDVYKYIHRSHHLSFFPSAFAAQAIHPVEAMMFAETSLIASIFLVPISVATQYICGLLLLVWSILAHDSRFLLDKGMHYEHHSHPHTNFGFLGFADAIMDTVWWGRAYDGEPKPEYIDRMRALHVFIFGKEPVIKSDGQSDDAELAAKIKAEMERRRAEAMQRGGKKDS